MLSNTLTHLFLRFVFTLTNQGSCKKARKKAGIAGAKTSFFAYKLTSNVKQCPKCDATVAKDDGCNHVSKALSFSSKFSICCFDLLRFAL
jgi:hypothetical protein